MNNSPGLRSGLRSYLLIVLQKSAIQVLFIRVVDLSKGRRPTSNKLKAFLRATLVRLQVHIQNSLRDRQYGSRAAYVVEYYGLVL